jgi:hypothetical protein
MPGRRLSPALLLEAAVLAGPQLLLLVGRWRSVRVLRDWLLVTHSEVLLVLQLAVEPSPDGGLSPQANQLTALELAGCSACSWFVCVLACMLLLTHSRHIHWLPASLHGASSCVPILRQGRGISPLGALLALLSAQAVCGAARQLVACVRRRRPAGAVPWWLGLAGKAGKQL